MSQTVQKRGLAATALRLFAMAGMLLDHAWATVVPGNFWMTCVGRLVFPIYAFQLVEGYFHTRDRKAYAKRLLILALVSEIPFNYLVAGGWFYPFHQNTVFTLLLGYLLLWGLESSLRPWKKTALVGASALVAFAGFVDYSWQGVFTVLLFYMSRKGEFSKISQLIGMIAVHVFCMEGQTLPWLFDLPLQSFAVLALIPIWLYNGEQGRGGRTMRWAGYLYYPLHMILLVTVRYLL